MNAPPVLSRHLPAESVGPVARLLPWLALFVRVSVGLGFLNGGLAAMISGGGGPGMIYGPGAGLGFFPGTDVLIKVLPYLELAVGLGLICGIFTTIMALIAWVLVLLIPILLTVNMFTAMAASMGTNTLGFGVGRGGMGLDFGVISVAVAVISTPCFALLVILSPQSINRLSLDAMIFPNFPSPPIGGPPSGPVELRIDDQSGPIDDKGSLTASVAGSAPGQVYLAPRPVEPKRLGFAIVAWSAIAGVPIWSLILWPLLYVASSSDGSYRWPVGAVMTAAVLAATGWILGNVVDRSRGLL